jgi:hypothetical protein
MKHEKVCHKYCGLYIFESLITVLQLTYISPTYIQNKDGASYNSLSII